MMRTVDLVIAGDGSAGASGELVSGNYFDVLGVSTRAGRPLSPHDDRTPGAHPIVVISEAFWERAFNSNPAIVGETLQLNGQTFTVIGVAAQRFTGTDIGLPADVWIPLAMQREVGRNLLTDARTNWLEMIGRLPIGTRREQAAEALNRDFERRASELPSRPAAGLLVLAPGDRGNSPALEDQKTALLVTFALTGLAFALAAINVAALAAIRSAARQKEMAIRLAIGARRSRLDRQLLTEGLVLAALGGLAALLIIPWTVRALITTYSTELAITLTSEPRVLAFVVLTSVLPGVVVAVVRSSHQGRLA